MSVNKPNILMTGGGGFIGRNIKETLSYKYNILAPKHHELELLDAVAVENFLKKHKIDILIHAANIGGTRKTKDIQNVVSINLKMFFNLARCNKYFKKMIFFGSGAEYDKSEAIIKVREEDFDKKVPKDDYGYYKYICSKYIEKADNIVNLRMFGIFGKYEDYEIRFISNAISHNLLGMPITINKNVYFDYVYINDFIKILDHFIKYNPKHKFYNIGTGQSIDLITIAKKINKIAEKKSKIIIENKGLNNEYTCNNRRLIKELKGFQFTDFDKSIKELYKWFKINKDNLR